MLARAYFDRLAMSQFHEAISRLRIKAIEPLGRKVLAGAKLVSSTSVYRGGSMTTETDLTATVDRPTTSLL